MSGEYIHQAVKICPTQDKPKGEMIASMEWRSEDGVIYAATANELWSLSRHGYCVKREDVIEYLKVKALGDNACEELRSKYEDIRKDFKSRVERRGSER